VPGVENSTETGHAAACSGGKQRPTGDAGAGRTLADVADPGRPAVEQHLRPNTLDSARVAIPPQPLGSPTPSAAAAPEIPSVDVTGAIPTVQGSSSGKFSMVQIPPSERLPDAVGGPVLRAAALKGDPAAAYEVGVRFAEGKGIAANLDEAAKWYDRAAQAGVVPAVFRLGTFYEKA